MPLADRLTGLAALVTGGANGIGAAVARRLAEEGAMVTIVDRDVAAGEALAQSIGAELLSLDVTDLDAVEASMRGRAIDILVNNAGADQHAFFTQTTPADWKRLIDVNLVSAFAFTHAALPGMQSRGFGRIVTISSEAGRMGSRGGAVYAAAKGGLIAFTRSIARENARYGITANVVLPGPIRTPMLEQAVASAGDGLLAAMEAQTLLRRLGEPEEVASAVAFLASREASYVTAETIGVSGGMGAS